MSDLDDEEEVWLEAKATPIHPKFFPFESDEPFKTCTICQENLDTIGDYLIEKAIKGNDVIFEIVYCMPCAERMRKGFSQKTRKAIDDFFQEHSNIEERAYKNVMSQSTELDDYIGHCLISKELIDPNEEHQIYAYCSEGQMHFAGYPFAMSGTSMDRIIELISPESQGFLDDFYNDFLIPDDLKDLLKTRPVLV